MDIKLHKCATTTPAIRRYMQASDKTPSQLARQFGVSVPTVIKWKNAATVFDGSHARHHQKTNFTPLYDELLMELRVRGLSLADITEVLNRCLPEKFARSSVHRALVRLNINRPPKVPKIPHGEFEQAACGFIHIDLKVLPNLTGKVSYASIAIDRPTRFVFAKIIYKRDAATITDCLEAFLKEFPHAVYVIITDNDGAFTDRFAVDKKNKPVGKPSGTHRHDLLCKKHNIEHRLIRPYHPQTNGMVERFNRRIGEAMATEKRIRAIHRSRNQAQKCFKTHEDRNQFIHTFVANYNKTRLACLNYKSPAEMMRNQAGAYIIRGKCTVSGYAAVFIDWINGGIGFPLTEGKLGEGCGVRFPLTHCGNDGRGRWGNYLLPFQRALEFSTTCAACRSTSSPDKGD